MGNCFSAMAFLSIILVLTQSSFAASERYSLGVRLYERAASDQGAFHESLYWSHQVLETIPESEKSRHRSQLASLAWKLDRVGDHKSAEEIYKSNCEIYSTVTRPPDAKASELTDAKANELRRLLFPIKASYRDYTEFLAGQSRYEDACSVHLRFLKILTPFEDVRIGRRSNTYFNLARLNLAYAYIKAGEDEKARKLIELVINIDDPEASPGLDLGNDNLVTPLALLYQRQGNWKRALSLVKGCYDLNKVEEVKEAGMWAGRKSDHYTSMSNCFATLVELYGRAKKKRIALAYGKRAAERFQYGESKIQLVNIYVQLGYDKEAIELLKQVLADPEFHGNYRVTTGSYTLLHVVEYLFSLRSYSRAGPFVDVISDYYRKRDKYGGLLELARLHSHDLPRAVSFYGEVWKHLSVIDRRYQFSLARTVAREYGDLLLSQGQIEKARNIFCVIPPDGPYMPVRIPKKGYYTSSGIAAPRPAAAPRRPAASHN